MILLVFGAGASFDSDLRHPARQGDNVDHRHRMPLAAHLFDNRPEFNTAMSLYPQFKPVLNHFYYDGIVQEPVEKVLQALSNEALQGDKVRYRQLAAIRFYLRHAISEFQKTWIVRLDGVSNYLSLLESIRHAKPNEEVCIVTFNYDTLIEDALQSMNVPIAEIDDYISHPQYKLIKLHGSVNWAREVETYFFTDEDRNRNRFNIDEDQKQLERQLINRFDELEISNRFVILNDRPFHMQLGLAGEKHLFPALAIPVEEKNQFECPEAHISVLHNILPRVDRVITVGWRGMELPFLELLSKYLSTDVKIKIVSDDTKNAVFTREFIRKANIEREYSIAETGFSRFVSSRVVEKFLTL